MHTFFVFIFGAILGSFLNVCIYRLPRHKSIVRPPSYCPNCKRSIPWYDNIPVVSYIVLMGKCGKCRKRISFRYPFVEVATALLAVTLYHRYGFGGKFAVYSAFVSALMVSTFVDFEFGEIPDEITLGGLAAGLIASLAFPGLFGETAPLAALRASALGAVTGGGATLAMGLFGKLIFRKDAMGGGDVKLMAMIGSVLGWKLALLTFFIAPFFGAAVGITLKAAQGRETIPYGPYLSLAAFIAMFYGNDILRRIFGGM
jgi:leader peptidase (prepilin peptidase)/N-methyltransferase